MDIVGSTSMWIDQTLSVSQAAQCRFSISGVSVLYSFVRVLYQAMALIYNGGYVSRQCTMPSAAHSKAGTS